MPSIHEATTFYAEDGFVCTYGPHLALRLTAEEAIQASDGITDAAAEALGQRAIAEAKRTLKPT